MNELKAFTISRRKTKGDGKSCGNFSLIKTQDNQDRLIINVLCDHKRGTLALLYDESAGWVIDSKTTFPLETLSSVFSIGKAKTVIEKKVIRLLQGAQVEDVSLRPEEHQVKKIVLLNGPPGSGKDASSFALRDVLGAKLVKMSAPLKNAVHSLLGSSAQEVEEKSLKESKIPGFDLTWRQAYIWMSEDVAKVKFGADIFGKITVEEIKKCNSHNLFVITDAGFKEECNHLLKEFGPENILLVRCHRPDKTFVGDSRSYLSFKDQGIKEVDLDNNASLQHWCDIVCQCVDTWRQKESS